MTSIVRKIKDIKFCVASTGNPVTKIMFEDQKEYEMPVEFFGEENLIALFLSKTVGSELTVDTSGKWSKFTMTADEAKPSGKALKENILRLLRQKNEDREVVSPEFMQNEFVNWLKIEDLFFDKAVEYYTDKNNKSELSKMIKENLELTKAKQTVDPIAIISSKAYSFRREFEKKYVALLDNVKQTLGV